MNKQIIGLSTIVLLCGISNNADAALATDASLFLADQQRYSCYYGAGVYPDCLAFAVPESYYFAMDQDGSGVVEEGERQAIEAGPDGGILLGVNQSDFPSIDATWDYFRSPGNHTQAGTLSIASDDGNGNATINMSGWTIYWGNPQAPIDMGQGADAIVTCGNTCEAGDTFTLDYNTVVPSGFFQGVTYQLHLEGCIRDASLNPCPGPNPPEVPIPAAIWLFGSGLLGLIGIARRKKS